jgi:hypothetical protein
VTLGTFQKFAQEMRTESRRAADDQPLGADPATAAAVDASPESCGAKGTRTPDPLLAKQVLFQLSYSPKKPQVRRPSAQIPMCTPAQIGDGDAPRSGASVKDLLLARCYRA